MSWGKASSWVNGVTMGRRHVLLSRACWEEDRPFPSQPCGAVHECSACTSGSCQRQLTKPCFTPLRAPHLQSGDTGTRRNPKFSPVVPNHSPPTPSAHLLPRCCHPSCHLSAGCRQCYRGPWILNWWSWQSRALKVLSGWLLSAIVWITPKGLTMLRHSDSLSLYHNPLTKIKFLPVSRQTSREASAVCWMCDEKWRLTG